MKETLEMALRRAQRGRVKSVARTNRMDGHGSRWSQGLLHGTENTMHAQPQNRGGQAFSAANVRWDGMLRFSNGAGGSFVSSTLLTFAVCLRYHFFSIEMRT